jgi:PAS domain-containing protein
MSMESRPVEQRSPVGGWYERLLRASGTYRARLVVRLAGEAGLRPAEMCRLRPADVSARVADGRVHHLLAVRDEDGASARTAYLPSGVAEELSRYVSSDGIGEEEPVFEVTPRRLQMLVGEVADAAADAAGGDEELRTVSTADLRRRHGRWLVQRGVDPAVVLAVGGWRRLDSLAPDGDLDEADVADAFARTAETGDGRFRAAFDRLDHAVALLGADGSVTDANAHFESLVERETGGVPVHRLVEPAGGGWGPVWATALGGESWTGEAAIGTEGLVAASVTVAATGRRGDQADGFVLSVHPEPGRKGGDLSRLRSVQTVAGEAGAALGEANTAEAVLRAACEVLASSEPYEFAWASRTETDGEDDLVACRGVDHDTVGGLRRAVETGTEPAPSVTGELRSATVEHEGRDRWVVQVPLRHDEGVSGVLSVGAPVEPDDAERAALTNLGGRVAGAVAAVEWKRLLLADNVLELEFQTTDQDSLFVAGSQELACSFRVTGLVPLDGGSFLYYVTVSGAVPDEVLNFARERLESARLVADHGEESVLEVTMADESVPGQAVEFGANVRELVAEDGTARLTCEVAPSADVRELAEAVRAGSPSATLVAKREVEPSARSPTEFQRSLAAELTDRQRSVLQAAYHAGYFDWPRGSTAEDLADSIGVSSPTLHNHLRRGQRKLLASFFEE